MLKFEARFLANKCAVTLMNLDGSSSPKSYGRRLFYVLDVQAGIIITWLQLTRDLPNTIIIPNGGVLLVITYVSYS